MSYLECCAQAVPELVKFANSSHSSTADTILFGSVGDKHHDIFVDVNFIEPPRSHRVPFFVTLPNEMYGQKNICLVVQPPQRKVKDALLDLHTAVSARVEKVIDSKKLLTKYQDPVSLRSVAKSFELFVVLGTSTFPPLLTGEFLSHRTPVWVPRSNNLNASLEQAVRTTVVPRRGQSNISAIIGNAGMKTDAIIENLAEFILQLQTILRNGLETDVLNIAVSINTGKKVSLVIYAHNFIASHLEGMPKRKRVE